MPWVALQPFWLAQELKPVAMTIAIARMIKLLFIFVFLRVYNRSKTIRAFKGKEDQFRMNKERR